MIHCRRVQFPEPRELSEPNGRLGNRLGLEGSGTFGPAERVLSTIERFWLRLDRRRRLELEDSGVERAEAEPERAERQNLPAETSGGESNRSQNQVQSYSEHSECSPNVPDHTDLRSFERFSVRFEQVLVRLDRGSVAITMDKSSCRTKLRQTVIVGRFAKHPL